MLIPMFVLAALAIGSGWINVNGWFDRFFGGDISHSASYLFTMFEGHHYLPLISLIVALLGVALSYAMYIRRQPSGESVGRLFPVPYRVFSRKYWMDELYERVLVVRVMLDGVFWVLEWIDSNIVDGLVNGIAGGTVGGARIIRQAQTGRLQGYGLVMFVGIIIIAGFTYLFVR
jgi:NADH-quinone oxidoreductase subunit L